MIILKRFIVLEGIDGSGKSTQIRLLKQSLESLGFRVYATREPGGTIIGEKVRAILLDRSNSEMTLRTEALLYAACRAQLVEQVILPRLNLGEVVLCERFLLSSIAYQAYGAGLDRESVLTVNRFACNGVYPGLTILLDLDPYAHRSRIKGTDRIESRGLDYLKRVREGYLQEAKLAPGIKVVDASASVEEVHRSILHEVLAFLNVCTEP